MAYNANLPADNGFIADGPGELRENFRALKEDTIVNAGKLKGLEPGHASGNIPVSDGTLNSGLNADQLDGHDSAYFSADGHVHGAATPTSNGFMSNTDKAKLDGIAAGAEVNQNAFAKFKVGSSMILADNKEDTLELLPGSNINITPDAVNDKITIGLPSSLDVNITGSAAKCNGCGEVVPPQLTNDNAGSHRGSGFYRTEGGVTSGGGAGQQFSAVIQFMRGSARGARIIAATGADNTNHDMKAQLFNGAWGPLKTFVMQGDAFSGNAASATKLQTKRTINGVGFDGTANITITAAANGGTSAACSGNAASATKLQSARKITIKHFKAFFNANGTVGRTSDIGYASFNGAGDVTINVGCASGCATTCVSGCANGCFNGCSGNCANVCSGSCSGGCGGDN